VTPVGPLGDLDGDGIDDGCAYPADRLTFFAPSVRLTVGGLSAMLEYERLLQMLGGAPGVGSYWAEWGALLGGGWTLPDELVPVPDPNNPGSGSCVQQYYECMRRADIAFSDRVEDAQGNLKRCTHDRFWFIMDMILICGASAVTGPGYFKCVAGVILMAAHLYPCEERYQEDMEVARQRYQRDREDCERDALANGCIFYVPM